MHLKARKDKVSASDLLSGVELRGQTWCYTNLDDESGFSLPHSNALMFHMVLHGSVKIACAGGQTIPIRAGEAAMILLGQPHALRTAAASRADKHEFLICDHDLDIPETVLRGTGPVTARVLSGRLHAHWPSRIDRSALPAILLFDQSMGGLIGALLRPEALPSTGIGAGAAALLSRIASLLLVAGLRSSPHCRDLVSRRARDPIGLALQMIQADPSENWTVERLAHSAGMGRSSFCAHFTQQVGLSPMALVTKLRMEKAAALLRGGKFKIAEVSEIVGYSSEAAFSRRFSRHFGISPKQIDERVWPGNSRLGASDTGQTKADGDWLAAGVTGNCILDWQTEWQVRSLQ